MSWTAIYWALRLAGIAVIVIGVLRSDWWIFGGGLVLAMLSGVAHHWAQNKGQDE